MASDHANGHGFSIRELCRRWRCGQAKVREFIRRGELLALNIAADPGAKPQWRVVAAELERFEQRRSSAPTPKATRKRRPQVIDYFPELT
jgi:hypothetical protein